MLRQFLFSILGFDRYLRLISYVFLKTYLSKLYLPDHYQVRFLAKLVKHGDYCIDIGANLGYFSIPLSRLCGANGKVFSVEPVAQFREKLEHNLQKFGLPNFEVLPYALGDEDDKKIQLGTPKVDGVIRHGRTEVIEENDTSIMETAFTHAAIMKRPESLFADLPKLHFIKCDVEGFELHIVPHILGLLEKFRPVLEIESDPLENKRQLMEWIIPLKYQVFYLQQGHLLPFNPENTSLQKEIELYFIPEEKISSFSDTFGN